MSEGKQDNIPSQDTSKDKKDRWSDARELFEFLFPGSDWKNVPYFKINDLVEIDLATGKPDGVSYRTAEKIDQAVKMGFGYATRYPLARRILDLMAEYSQPLPSKNLYPEVYDLMEEGERLGECVQLNMLVEDTQKADQWVHEHHALHRALAPMIHRTLPIRVIGVMDNKKNPTSLILLKEGNRQRRKIPERKPQKGGILDDIIPAPLAPQPVSNR